MSTTSSSEKNQQWQRQIHVKLSAIFKYEVSDTPQSFGSFFESIGKRYCAVSVLSKYLGYDIATASNKGQNEKNMLPAELIPYDILEMRISLFKAVPRYSHTILNILEILP